MQDTAYPHIQINSKGVPCIDGTRTKVIDIALARVAEGWDPDEIQRQHPHFTLGQIYSALSYYFDHREELDKDIQERRLTAQRLRKEIGDSPVAAKLRAIKASREAPEEMMNRVLFLPL